MIRVRQVKVSLDKKKEEIIQKLSLKLQVISTDITQFTIHKESLDARKKGDIHYSLEIDVAVKKEEEVLKKNISADVLKVEEEKYQFLKRGETPLHHKPVIVGTGPAGLFTAYLLAENGYNPIIIERGEKIEDRVKTVRKFWEMGHLNKESGVQFGEGGAGTFSDGKLNTLVKDKMHRSKKVLETFVQNGAPKEILYTNKPHIGTDLLRNVIVSMRNKIIEMGGEFLYNTCLTDLNIKNGKITSIEVNNSKIVNCDVLILAIGHSARDTFKMLYDKKIEMEAKPFAIGVRIMHPQSMINKAQYGVENHPKLPPASYKLTYTASNQRGVYSFCMCPGGYVINSSSEENGLVVNGMSNHKRDSENANSAIIVSVTPKDFGEHPLDGIHFQRELEEKAYQLGKGKIPIQLWKDFKANTISTSFGKVNPTFEGEYNFSNLRNILPSYIGEALIEGVEVFDRKIRGFAREDVILAGIESRTSSPLRILRDEMYLSNIKGVYPCGEGSGYAGGIITSAMDGIKVAEAVASMYKSS